MELNYSILPTMVYRREFETGVARGSRRRLDDVSDGYHLFNGNVIKNVLHHRGIILWSLQGIIDRLFNDRDLLENNSAKVKVL